MKVVDTSKEGICEVSWSADGKWITYVKDGDAICKAKADGTGTSILIAKGHSPGFNSEGDIIFERNDEIYIHHSGKESVFISKSDIIVDTAKRKPTPSLDGKTLVFSIDNVFDKTSEKKNAYPYRNFLGIASATGKAKPVMLETQQWYGGRFIWFPDNEHFLHYEYDSTGGARIHLTNTKGEKLGHIFGLYPSISPDVKRVACKPKGGQTVVVYVSKSDTWTPNEVETVVTKLPEGGRLSGSPPIWLDNRSVLIDEGGKLFRVDTRKQEASEMKKIPTPVRRGNVHHVHFPI